MPRRNDERDAERAGADRASEILAFRNTQLKLRQRALKSKAAPRPTPTPALTHLRALSQPATVQPSTAALARVGAGANKGVLVAEGDSWFDYPFHDVLRLLEDEHGYDVESVAHKGDRVEDMAYADGQLEEFARRLEKVLRRGEVPRAILLSGGGNDVAGEELAILLNHAASPNPGLNDDIVRGVVDHRIRLAYIAIISTVTALCEGILERRVPVILHGYDYPVPDGRGFLGGFGPLPGPWLEPSLRRKGYADRTKNVAMMKQLIDRFNVMVEALTQRPSFGHVRYVNLRDTLSNAAGNYKRFWANELHPTGVGFSLIAAKFAAAI